MADEVVVIDVQAKFTDNTSSGVKKAKKSVADFEDTVKDTEATLNKMSKKKHSVKVTMEDKATSGIQKVLKNANKIHGKRFKGTLAFLDKASTVASKVTKTAKAFASKTFKGTISFIDKAIPVVDKAINKAKSFTSKVWRSTLSVVDKFTSPLTKLKNMLFNINTLIATVATGLATKFIVADPIKQADTLTTAQIFFETKLGSTGAADKMLNSIKDFAVETPFETDDIVSYTQSMLAMGFEADNVLTTLNKIGNTSAALGKGSEGIDSIVRALGQMQMKGKVSAEEMLQLTEAGVNGWGYIAKGVGKSTAQVQEMVSKGLIPVEDAIGYILQGMDEYDGMMQKTANKTVSGLASQIKDTFSIAIVEKWGKGLQKGAVAGLESFNDFLGKIDGNLQSAGTSLEDLGETLSTKVFDVLGGVQERFEKVVNTDEFKNADLGEKIKIVWDEVIWEPFSDWWEGKGKPKLIEKMGEFGESLGTGISNGLLALLGFDVEGAANDGASIGSSFANGFAEGFDGEAVGTALWEAIKKGFSSGGKGLTDLLLPGDQGATGGQKLMGLGMGYLGLKTAPTLWKAGKGIYTGGKTIADAVSVVKGTKAAADVGKGAGTLAKVFGLPSKISQKVATSLFNTASGNGTGLFSKLSFNATNGIGLSGKLSSLGTSLGSGAGTAAGSAAVGGGAVLGGILGALGLVDAGTDVYKAVKSENKKDKKTYGITAGTKTGLVGAGAGIGAAIGSVVPVVGTAAGALIGAGIGGAGALLGGDKLGSALSDATDEGGWLNNAGKSIKSFFTETIPEKFGEFTESAGEFFTETIPTALENVGEKISTFFTETIPEKWDEFWEGVGEFFTEDVPYALGYAAGKVTTFFTETLPEKWDEFWEGVGEFFENVGDWFEKLGEKVTEFFTETLPEKWDSFWESVGTFFTETLPTWASDVWNNNIVPFFTEDVPTFFSNLWTSIVTFFTETLPTWASDLWNNDIVPFFTETIPGFFSDVWDSVTSFFTEKLPSIASEIWGSISGWFTSVKDWFGSVWEKVKGSFSAGYEEGSGGGKKAAKNAAGGYIGSKTLSWLAEEGTPEMVIPLGSHRRGRAISLWMQTGEMLGITPQRNALGGIVGADSHSGSDSSMSYRFAGIGTVQINMGGITFQINTGGDASDILAAIKAQKDAICEVLTEALYEALVKQFENMPLAV